MEPAPTLASPQPGPYSNPDLRLTLALLLLSSSIFYVLLCDLYFYLYFCFHCCLHSRVHCYFTFASYSQLLEYRKVKELTQTDKLFFLCFYFETQRSSRFSFLLLEGLCDEIYVFSHGLILRIKVRVQYTYFFNWRLRFWQNWLVKVFLSFSWRTRFNSRFYNCRTGKAALAEDFFLCFSPSLFQSGASCSFFKTLTQV